MFVNRLKDFRVLDLVANGITKKEKMNIAIIGNRRIGKTELLLEFKKKWQQSKTIIVPYLNVQRLGNINSFIFSYYRELLFELGKKRGLIENKFDLSAWDDVLILSAKLQIDDITGKLKNLNDMDALSFLFEIQEEILEKTGFVLVYLLDEFQYVEHFGERFTAVMRSIVEKQEKTAYVVTGSSISLMEKIFSQNEEPFFAQFRRIYLGSLDKQSSKELAKSFLGKYGLNLDDSSNNELFRLTDGHPFYVVSLCRRLTEDFDGVDVKKIRYAFLEETLSPKGDIYLVLDYIFNDSLSRAYKGGVHRQILLILAENQGLTLTEVARELNKPSGEVSNYLKVLLKTDLLLRDENNYYFRDPLLAFWLKNTYLGIDDNELRKEMVRDDLISELTEKYLKTSSELGKAKEYEFKVKLEEKFGLKLKNYVSTDGQIEFDLVGERSGIYHIFEIKWRNKQANYKDVKNFLEKIAESGFNDKTVKLYFLSKAGFTVNARDLGDDNRIKFLDKKMYD